jgi:hypothetical protein
MKDGAGELLHRQDGQPIGLLHVRSHLGEQPVDRDADRARQAFADVALNLTLDPQRRLFLLLARGKEAVQIEHQRSKPASIAPTLCETLGPEILAPRL